MTLAFPFARPALLSFSLLIACHVQAQTPYVEWAGRIGGTEAVYSTDVSVDGEGHAYATGYFYGTVDLDPGDGVSEATSLGSTDGFLCRFAPDGSFLWGMRVGGTGTDRITSVAVDDSGYVYTTGYFSGTVDFDPGLEAFTLSSSNDAMFILKLAADRSFVWAKKIAGSNGVKGEAISIDEDGNVYTTGQFSATADFDPDPDGDHLLTSAGSWDGFVCKLDRDGNFRWAGRIGGQNSVSPKGLATDWQGNVTVVGMFQGTVDLDPGAGSHSVTSAGSADGFVCKLDSLGNFIYGYRTGGTGNDQFTDVAADASGNVLATGYFNGSVDFDPGEEEFIMTGGFARAFIVRTDIDGIFQWAKQVGTTGNSYGHGIAVGQGGNITLTGNFGGSVDFDPGPGEFIIAATGTSQDGFVCSLNPAGDFRWAGSFKSTGGNSGTGVTAGADGTVWAVGDFWLSAQFLFGQGSLTLTSAGNADVAVMRLMEEGVGLHEAVGSTLRLYPNPATDRVFLTVNEQGFTHVQVGNMLGQVVWSADINGRQQLELPLDGPSGIYTVTLLGRDGSRTVRKVVRQ